PPTTSNMRKAGALLARAMVEPLPSITMAVVISGRPSPEVWALVRVMVLLAGRTMVSGSVLLPAGQPFTAALVLAAVMASTSEQVGPTVMVAPAARATD